MLIMCFVWPNHMTLLFSTHTWEWLISTNLSGQLRDVQNPQERGKRNASTKRKIHTCHNPKCTKNPKNIRWSIFDAQEWLYMPQPVRTGIAHRRHSSALPPPVLTKANKQQTAGSHGTTVILDTKCTCIK